MQYFVLFSFLCSFFAPGFSECEEGWVEFNNEKCYKVFEDFVTHENAVSICSNEHTASETPKLLEILTFTEQAFVSSFIFEELQIFDNVWLGAVRYNETSFQWSDGGSLVYENWLNGAPSNDVNNNCSQLSSGVLNTVTSESGLWTDVPCSKRNIVVCQTASILTLKQLQDMLFNVIKNPVTSVPIGFIYTEYPQKPSPQSLWPSLVWKDVTSEYAGFFFRAEGGSSEPFGVAQSDNAPRVTDVGSIGGTDTEPPLNATLPVGDTSEYVHGGFYNSEGFYNFEGLRFTTSGGEVRPINQAVRMWERVG